jgi:DNA-binding NarL/FixJ family response regulator
VPVSIVVADSSPLAAQLLCRALKEQRSHFVVVGSRHTPEELFAQVAEHQPDVAVVSSILQGNPRGGLEAVRALRNFGSRTRPIVLLDRSDLELVVEAFSAGAKGVVCQTDPLEILCKCIRCVHAGQIWANSRELQWVVRALGDREPVRLVSAKGVSLLSQREQQIVNMVMEGLRNHEIAEKLHLSAHTVKNHLFRVYEKLGISNRTELILYAQSSRQSTASP